MARRGAQVVVAMGFAQAAAVETVAQEFPETKFTLIDMVVDLPNVQSVVVQGARGLLPGRHGGRHGIPDRQRSASSAAMDIPLIRKFALGYVEGAKHVNPDIEIFQNMTGTTPSAWNDPTKGGELARSQFDRGADVVYAAAGGTGIGVYQAAKDAGKLAIGVDSNQNYIHPGTMLTSMIKRVDVAVYESFRAAQDGTWQGGIQVLGLAEDGVGWALDEHNRSLISAEMEAAIEQARTDIIAGKHRGDPTTWRSSAGAAARPAGYPGASPVAGEEHRGAAEERGPSGGSGVPALEVAGIQKWFGSVHANDDVSVAIDAGTIHGIIGENGAGKSTR